MRARHSEICRGLAASLLLAGGMLPACSGGGGGGSDEPPVDDTAALEAHVQSRAGYGPDAWSRTRIAELGVDAYLEEQLDPTAIPDPDIDAALADFETLDLTFRELIDRYRGMQQGLPVIELVRAKLLRAVLSRRQLEHVLTDFWFDHFNVFGADGFTNFAVGPYERDAIRPHVLGRFEDMLTAVASHAAMLYYLDNYLSSKEGFVFQGEERGLNENWARELLELHTLSPEAGYTQEDVIEVARAFTGWTIGPEAISDENGFFFWPAAHDDDTKSIFGGELFIPAGGGMQDALDVIGHLTAHSQTAAFLCKRLVQRFIDESAPAGAVADCRDTYLATDGDLGEVMRTILFSAEFRGPDHRDTKVKRPVVYVPSLLRATGAALDPEFVNFYLGLETLMGESAYQARPPTGYPDLSSHWAAGGTLVSRINGTIVIAFAADALGIDWGTSGGSAEEIVAALVAKLLPGGVDDRTFDDVVDHVNGLGPVGDAVRVGEAASMLLSSPDFARH